MSEKLKAERDSHQKWLSGHEPPVKHSNLDYATEYAYHRGACDALNDALHEIETEPEKPKKKKFGSG